jgi:hypothetical protein
VDALKNIVFHFTFEEYVFKRDLIRLWTIIYFAGLNGAMDLEKSIQKW